MDGLVLFCCFFFHRIFDFFFFSDVLDYVKTGVAAIIEDEVTQRFVAEELKNWNLLTREASMKNRYLYFKLSIFSR